MYSKAIHPRFRAGAAAPRKRARSEPPPQHWGPVVRYTNCRIVRDHQLLEEDLWVQGGVIVDPAGLPDDVDAFVLQKVRGAPSRGSPFAAQVSNDARLPRQGELSQEALVSERRAVDHRERQKAWCCRGRLR